jgi:hypothetical protein
MGLYDEDEKDLDNLAKVDDHDVADVVKRLPGRVILAWNGPFFAYTADRQATHIGPVIIDNRIRYNVGNHRWTFGQDLMGRFVTLHMPNKFELMQGKFWWGAAGLQCVVKDGRPLRLEAFPTDGVFKKGPVPSTEDEAGHIPINDHIRTSRTSIAWSKDNKTVYVLLLLAPELELQSKMVLKQGGAPQGGWTLADVQRFWSSVGVWGAVNSDGGSVTQRVYAGPDGAEVRHAQGAPTKGTLMTFYITETK